MKNSPKIKLPSQQRKSQILNAARHLFSKKGYDKTTLDEISKRVGVSRPRVIQLFGSKEKIYKAIAETAYVSHPIDKDLGEPISRKNDLAVFETFAAHILRYTASGKDREIFKILMYARLRDDEFHRTHFHEKDNLMISRLLAYVQSRIKEGAFREMDHRTIVYAYQAMISNLVIYKNVLHEMDFVGIEELARDCARIFLGGILVSENIPISGKGGQKNAKQTLC